MNDSTNKDNKKSIQSKKPSHSKRPSLWGWGVAALYSGFVLFMLILVGYSSMQNFDMVEDDYYVKGLNYQQQIDKSVAAKSLTKGLSWSFDQRTKILTVTFPDNLSLDSLGGIISFFRPANSRLDLVEKINPDSDYIQEIDCASLVKGQWKLKIDWAVGEQEYYNEDLLIIE